jgi:hypothetical protein
MGTINGLNSLCMDWMVLRIGSYHGEYVDNIIIKVYILRPFAFLCIATVCEAMTPLTTHPRHLD